MQFSPEKSSHFQWNLKHTGKSSFLVWVFLMIPQTSLSPQINANWFFSESCHTVEKAKYTYGWINKFSAAIYLQYYIFFLCAFTYFRCLFSYVSIDLFVYYRGLLVYLFSLVSIRGFLMLCLTQCGLCLTLLDFCFIAWWILQVYFVKTGLGL